MSPLVIALLLAADHAMERTATQQDCNVLGTRVESQTALPAARRRAEALKARRIGNREDYEVIIDSFGQQTAQDQETLNNMIREFEKRSSKQ